MNAIATDAPSYPQHMRALERANEVRVARAELKRRVAFGDIDAAEVILYCPWEARSMAVAELLICQHSWGASRCRKILGLLPISERKTVGSMTDRQRHALATLVGAQRATSPHTPSTGDVGDHEVEGARDDDERRSRNSNDDAHRTTRRNASRRSARRTPAPQPTLPSAAPRG
jgi:hypothetical protein